MQGKYAEAEPLYARCQAIVEKALGPEHPSLATTLNNCWAFVPPHGTLLTMTRPPTLLFPHIF